ncbi:MAG: TatD family hydrolase [Terriglobia bacterium]
MASYTDSHAHLAAAEFEPDRAAVVARAQEAGVVRILTIANGTTLPEFERALALTDGEANLWVAVGVHPHDARHAQPSLLANLKKVARRPGVLAWGEIGLDYHYDHSPRETQRTVFREQLCLAGELELPVVIHCRDAWEDCLETLDLVWAATGRGGILHCFSGTLADARQATGWNFLISCAGNLTFPRADNLRAVAEAMPLQSLLIETDCPFLAPQTYRGQRNEPAYVCEVAAERGRLKKSTSEEVGQITNENFLRLFPRARRARPGQKGCNGQDTA